jgi:hypothetical protein
LYVKSLKGDVLSLNWPPEAAIQGLGEKAWCFELELAAARRFKGWKRKPGALNLN